MIQVKENVFSEIFRQQSSENFLVNLQIEGAQEKNKLAFVQDAQRNPLTGRFIHLDFLAVQDDEIIHATIPVELTGECEGVKAGGLLEHLLHSLEIHCKPADLPERLEYDVTHVQVGESVKVSDLELPEGVTTKMDGDVLIGLVTKSRASISADAGGGGAEEEEGEEAAASEEAESEG